MDCLFRRLQVLPGCLYIIRIFLLIDEGPLAYLECLDYCNCCFAITDSFASSCSGQALNLGGAGGCLIYSYATILSAKPLQEAGGYRHRCR